MEWVFDRNCLIITYKVTKNIPFPQLFNTFLTSNSRYKNKKGATIQYLFKTLVTAK